MVIPTTPPEMASLGVRRLLKEQIALASWQSPALNKPVFVYIITFVL